MGIVVIGDVFIDVKGYSTAPFIPGGRNAGVCLLYTSPSPRDPKTSRMPSSA